MAPLSAGLDQPKTAKMVRKYFVKTQGWTEREGGAEGPSIPAQVRCIVVFPSPC